MHRFAAALAATAVLGAVTLVSAPPAMAHEPSVTFDPPLPPLSVWSTSPSVNGHADHEGQLGEPMSKVTLTWSNRDGQTQPGACTKPAPKEFSGSGTSIDFNQTAAFTCNGKYQVEVKADSAGSAVHPATSATETRDVNLEMAPAKVTGLNASESGRKVTLRWSANGEADLWGYLVDRRAGSGDYQELVTTSQTTFVDESFSSSGGTYTYRVWAIRLGPEQDPGNVDDLVLASSPSNTDSVTVARTTSTTGGGSGGSGGGDGGSGGGDGGSGKPKVTIAPTPSGGRAGSADLSGFARLKQQADAEAKRRANTTTTDPGYSDELPYDSQGRRLNPDGSLAAGGDRSTFEEVVDRKAVMVPIAFGLLLFVGALQLRYLTRRARDLV